MENKEPAPSRQVLNIYQTKNSLTQLETTDELSDVPNNLEMSEQVNFDESSTHFGSESQTTEENYIFSFDKMNEQFHINFTPFIDNSKFRNYYSIENILSNAQKFEYKV